MDSDAEGRMREGIRVPFKRGRVVSTKRMRLPGHSRKSRLREDSKITPEKGKPKVSKRKAGADRRRNTPGAR